MPVITNNTAHTSVVSIWLVAFNSSNYFIAMCGFMRNFAMEIKTD